MQSTIKKIKQLLANPLLSGSLVMVIGINANNFLNYLYHFVIGHLLGPADYGKVAALVSFVALVGVIPLSLGPTVVKFISAAKNRQEINDLVDWFSKKSLIISSIVVLAIIIASPFVSSLLKVNSILQVIIIGSGIFFGLPTMINRSVLQGVLKFKELVVNIIVESGLKLIIGAILILIGFQVTGAVLAIFISVCITWFLSRIFIKEYIGNGVLSRTPQVNILKYSLPILIHSLATASFFSSDLILVRYFFPEHASGIYASLSNLGKVILFGAGPIASVMFPLISKRKSEGGKYYQVFFYSLLLTSLISFMVIAAYSLFPKAIILILYGSSFSEAIYLLPKFSIFSGLLAIGALFINFHLSLGQTKVVIISFIAAILQISGILFYHQNLEMVINVSIVVSASMLVMLFLYFIFETFINKRLQTKS